MAGKLGTNLECDNLPFLLNVYSQGIVYLICMYIFAKKLCFAMLYARKCILVSTYMREGVNMEGSIF